MGVLFALTEVVLIGGGALLLNHWVTKDPSAEVKPKGKAGN
jgi:hypothetical protein